MATNINTVKLKKCNVNNAKCKRINVNGIRVWNAVPDFLYQNGVVDGEYLITMTGSNSWNDNGYGLKSGDFLLNDNGSIHLGAGASSGYGKTYSCENKAVSNVMDLSGATHLRFIGYMGSGGAYKYSHWVYIDLIDNTDVVNTIFSTSQEAHTQAEHTGKDIDITVQIDNLDLDLTQVKLQLRYGYRHNAPWSNWYGGGGTLTISTIGTIS